MHNHIPPEHQARTSREHHTRTTRSFQYARRRKGDKYTLHDYPKWAKQPPKYLHSREVVHSRIQQSLPHTLSTPQDTPAKRAGRLTNHIRHRGAASGTICVCPAVYGSCLPPRCAGATVWRVSRCAAWVSKPFFGGWARLGVSRFWRLSPLGDQPCGMWQGRRLELGLAWWV